MSATLTREPPAWASEYDPYDHDAYEVIDGLNVEMPPMSADSQFVASRIVRHLSNYGSANNIGEACTETLFKLPLPIDRQRRPDVAFVPYSRWAKDRMPPATNAWDVLPDLCVEVVSPSDLADEIEDKIGEYLQAGVRQVWVVYPRHRLIFVRSASSPIQEYKRGDAVDGGEVLPGFRLPLAELFPSQS
ncbi:MAG: Uma2 family endonuclease [Gemmataceae bacterium]